MRGGGDGDAIRGDDGEYWGGAGGVSGDEGCGVGDERLECAQGWPMKSTKREMVLVLNG
jgi:hypothetical protein